MEQKFYVCEICGNMISHVRSSGAPVVCCGEKMKEVIPSSTDAALEKHVPVITIDGNIVTVSVGSVDHPMLPEHYIEWVFLHTEQGNQRKILAPGQAPKVQFALSEGDKVIGAMAYCNLHGLWKSE